MSTASTASTSPPGISRRRFLTYALATPTLAVAVRVVDDALGAEPVGATPGVPDILDLTDALTLAALPTQTLLVIEVTEANRVVVHVPRAEVGQGITTAMAMLAAEEMGAALGDVDVVLDDARPELLWNQMTGGSNSVHALYHPMRNAAAAARARLLAAAAAQWNLDVSLLVTTGSAVNGPDGLRLTFGELTVAASVAAPPVLPATKDPGQFTLVGRPTGRIDARDIVTGRARYALDVELPGALPTVVARPPTVGGSLAAFDATVARSMPGVVAVTRIPSGVAVSASTFHHALAARDALQASWNAGPNAALSDAQIFAKLRKATLPFVLPPLGVLSVDRTFEFAMAPHAPMETWSCTADVRADRAEIWCASKTPIVAQQAIALQLGMTPGQVTFHVVRGGGSFGHRLFWEPATEAALVSQAIGRPVRLMWTRNDDMRHGRQRPPSHHKVRATHLLGAVLTYEHRMATLPVDFGHGFGELLSAVGFDLLAVGATQTVFVLTQKVPYNFGVETQLLTDVSIPWPTSSWRSIYSGQYAVANEIMVDEIARAQRADPLAFRRTRISAARTRAVIDKVAAVGRWGRPMAPGTAQGIAIHEEYKSVVAYLVEIDCRDRADPRVTKAVCAVDVGRAINPLGLEAQMQGALTDGISLTLQAGLHVDNGAVREGSFGDYRYARMRHSAPEVQVHVMPPNGEPGGAGELGFPAAAAAVANAYARATGTTPTRFPIAG